MSRLIRLRERLRAQNAGKHYLKRTDETDCVADLCSEIDELEKALSFYANKENYQPTGWQGDQDPAAIERDGGKRARAALAKATP